MVEHLAAHLLRAGIAIAPRWQIWLPALLLMATLSLYYALIHGYVS